VSQLLSVATESCISPGDERAQLASVCKTLVRVFQEPSGRGVLPKEGLAREGSGAGGASVGATFGRLRSWAAQNARRRGHKRQRSPEMSDSISYTIREEEKDMDEKENECVAREAYAKTVDQQYKSKVKAYKQSKDLGRALLARLTDEEADLRRAATAWVHNFTERQRQSTSARGHCELRALWFSRARNEARALVGETVEGFSRTFFRTTLAWSLGEGCALDAVLDHKRSAVSHHEAYEDDISDAAPEGDDWAQVALPGVGRHK